MANNNNNNNTTIDTKMTKIFVGGLAWETQRDTMRRYFEQFGEIVEAVVITDKNTGRSKGYGFVTFKESEAAMRACQNMNPVIDGRRANCNLACLGASKPRPPPTSPRHGGTGRFRSSPGLVGSSPHYHQFIRGSNSSSSSSPSSFVQQQQQFPFPYSTYGFSGYSQEGMYPMNYYNHPHHLYGGGQQFSPYIGPSHSSGSTGMFHGYYPYYPQYNVATQSSNNHQAQVHQAQAHQVQAQVQAHQHHHGFYPSPPPMLQYPYLAPPPQQFTSQPPPPPMLSLPTSVALSLVSSSTLSSSTSISAGPTQVTKPVIVTTTTTTTTTNASPAEEKEEASNKDGQEEAITSTIKIED